MAEREGFEPPIALRLCLISSQVHSTGLCHLSDLGFPRRNSFVINLSIQIIDRFECLRQPLECRASEGACQRPSGQLIHFMRITHRHLDRRVSVRPKLRKYGDRRAEVLPSPGSEQPRNPT